MEMLQPFTRGVLLAEKTRIISEVSLYRRIGGGVEVLLTVILFVVLLINRRGNIDARLRKH